VLKGFLSYLKYLGRIKIILASTALLGVVGFSFFILTIMKKDSTAVLYSELNRDSVEAITRRLDQEDIPYFLSQDAKVIKIDGKSVYRVRALLAKEGLPLSGTVVGYEIFDKEDSLGTTNFLQNVKNVRARQGELGRTIEVFENVLRARVHLAVPQRELFSKESHRPTASVMLTLKSGAILSTQEVKAISHLVAGSVERLNEKDITIVDTKGNVLQMGGEEDAFGFGASYNMHHRSSYEKRIQSKIETLISKVVGFGNVEVKVNAEMYFDKVVTNAETYDPDKSAVRSSHSKEEREHSPGDSRIGGDVSMANNLPDSIEESDGIGNFIESSKFEDINNYEVSRIVQNTIKEVGSVKQISVSVLINDHYDSKTETFSPRSEVDMKKIEELVKAAIGYQESRDDKVIVVHMPFFKEDLPLIDTDSDQQKVWWKEHLASIVNASFAFLAFWALLFYVLRPLLSRFAIQKNDVNFVKANIQEGGDIERSRQIQEALFENRTFTASMSKSQDLERLALENPDKFVSVLRRWLNERKK
jgi:flagellar M-ring protein FliF